MMTKKTVALGVVALLTLGSAAQQQQRQKAYLVADAHMDTQWNWDVQTTIRDYVKKTLEQNLFLLGRYPDYVFNFEGAVKYCWMKEYYPDQYERIKPYVANGRWHLSGSGWDANETIICSPESWMRNILLGQTFYRQEFGREGTDVFLPDCFGFGYTLPTLASHCGLTGFSSQKLAWRTNAFYDGGRRYPFAVGLWQGIDGSRIMMTHNFNYAERWPDSDLSHSQQLLREVGESPLGVINRYYGTGDTGGSPTVASVRAVMKGVSGDGPIQIVSAASDQLFKDFQPYDRHPELPVYDGELLMDVHGNGCYTSQAAMKLYNRQNEHLGDAAERASVAADWLGTSRYPTKALTTAWQRVVWHQFHDDLTGTSIPWAYEFSWNDELLSLKQFADVLTHSVSAVADRMDTRVKGQPVVVYNNESYPVRALTEVAVAADRDYQVTGPDGRRVASQVVDRQGERVVLFDADVPATGFAVYAVKAIGRHKAAAPTTGRTLESSRYRLTVDEYGDVTSIVDKRSSRQLVAEGKSLRLVVFDDCRSEQWPAWEILKRTLDKAPKPVHDAVDISIEQGRLRQTMVIRKRYGESDIVQRIHLYEGSQADRIDFENEVDWCSLNALLKAEFPLSVSNEKATYDIGLGCVQRGNNRDNSFEVYAHEWTDLTDRSGDYGVTLLNDSRYGWDKPADNTLRLSLLYSPQPGRYYTYQGRQDFGHHVFTYSLVGHEGGLQPVDAVRQADRLNSPLRTFMTSRHAGELGRRFSFVSSDNDCVVVRAVKGAETADEYVVRVYEMGGQQTQQARLNFAGTIVKAVEADGTERTIGDADYEGNSLKVSVKPYSVKTYKVMLSKPQAPAAADYCPLTLDYDRHCFSYNGYRSAGDFEGGNSYAAELMDDELMSGGVPFRMGPLDAASGLTCRGGQLQLPADKDYRHLYLLVASDNGDRKATFTVGDSRQMAVVPYYTGFIGQWGHDGQTVGYLKDADVAWVGTHRHSAAGDEPYEFTYLFRQRLDIPRGARQVTLPSDDHIVVFAATVATDADDAVSAMPLFKTSLKENHTTEQQETADTTAPNVLKSARIIGVSGEVNDNERAANLTDGRQDTKWCDAQEAPYFVDFDLGRETTVSQWWLVNAACEQSSYITRTCLLQGRNSTSEDWRTLDMIDGNRQNVVRRSFTPATVRYVRLFVVAPTQGVEHAVRIYELGVN